MRDAARPASPVQIRRQAACMVRVRIRGLLANQPDTLRPAIGQETPLSEAEVQFGIEHNLIRPASRWLVSK